MTFTYTWGSEGKTSLKREDEAGNYSIIPTDPANRDYAEFLSSGAVAADYVAPPTPRESTAAEKLTAAGLTVEELKALLAG